MVLLSDDPTEDPYWWSLPMPRFDTNDDLDDDLADELGPEDADLPGPWDVELLAEWEQELTDADQSPLQEAQ
jgi:hypothetical protein